LHVNAYSQIAIFFIVTSVDVLYTTTKTMEATTNGMGSQEVAVVVLQHLLSHGFIKTARAFRRCRFSLALVT
jgi:hypothetical protein